MCRSCTRLKIDCTERTLNKTAHTLALLPLVKCCCKSDDNSIFGRNFVGKTWLAYHRTTTVNLSKSRSFSCVMTLPRSSKSVGTRYAIRHQALCIKRSAPKDVTVTFVNAAAHENIPASRERSH